MCGGQSKHVKSQYLVRSFEDEIVIGIDYKMSRNPLYYILNLPLRLLQKV